MNSELSQCLRDANHHLKLVNKELAAVRDALGTVLQANMAVISNQQTETSVRQNETMKQLTLVATVFLPLSCNGTVATSAKCLTAMIAFADPAPKSS